MYNQDEFIKILKKCQGQFSLNEFARKIDVDSGYLSRIINKKRTNPPTPKILEKIAKASNEITTYDELMQICGYIADRQTIKVKQSIFDNDNEFCVVPILVFENGKLCLTETDVVLPFKWDGMHQYFGYKHINDEMAPILSTKDIAIMEECNTYVSGKTYLIQLDNEVYIRKIILKDTKIELQALNPYFPIITLTTQELEKRHFNILGRMIKSENTSYFE